jgi:hypothetical protein
LKICETQANGHHVVAKVQPISFALFESLVFDGGADGLETRSLVERILSHRSPKARYTVGMPGQRIVAPLKRLLPQRIIEWLFRRVIET